MLTKPKSINGRCRSKGNPVPQRKASGHIKLSDETLGLIRDNLVEKGDVLTVAR